MPPAEALFPDAKNDKPAPKVLPKLTQLENLPEMRDMRKLLYPEGADKPSASLTFVIRQRLYELLINQTDGVPADSLLKLAHSVHRKDDGQLVYPAEAVDVKIYSSGNGMRISQILGHILQIQYLEKAEPVPLPPPEKPGELFQKREGKYVYRSHFIHLDALMFRLLGLNEEWEPLEHADADTFVLQLHDDFYSDVLKVQLEMNAMRHFYSGPDVGELKTHAGRSLGSPDKAQKNGWDIDLKSLEQKCNSIPDKGKKSVIVVPVDSFYSYQNISIDKSIPNRYATAIARARKNGHTILVTTKKPLSAHKLFFGATGFYKQIFGNDTLTDSAPNVIAFSPQKCEIDRVHQIAILDLLYLASVREIQEEIVLAPLRMADGMELFEDTVKSSAAIEQKLSEIQNRVKFLKELSLILSLRPEGIHSIPPLQGPSELQQLSDILRKDGYSWNKNVMTFLSSNLKIKVNSDIVLQKLWQQFCLFSYEWGVENAMERANQRYNRADVSPQDSLALGFDYFLAKLIHREWWWMPDTSSLTPWSPADLEAFETQNAGNEILDVSFGEHLFPNPGPYKDEKTGAMIYNPADLIKPLR